MSNQSNPLEISAPAISGNLFEPLTPPAISGNLLSDPVIGIEIDPIVDFVQRLCGRLEINSGKFYSTPDGLLGLTAEYETIEALAKALADCTSFNWGRCGLFVLWFSKTRKRNFCVIRTYPDPTSDADVRVISEHGDWYEAESMCGLENLGCDYSSYTVTVRIDGKFYHMDATGETLTPYFPEVIHPKFQIVRYSPNPFTTRYRFDVVTAGIGLKEHAEQQAQRMRPTFNQYPTCYKVLSDDVSVDLLEPIEQMGQVQQVEFYSENHSNHVDRWGKNVYQVTIATLYYGQWETFKIETSAHTIDEAKTNGQEIADMLYFLDVCDSLGRVVT